MAILHEAAVFLAAAVVAVALFKRLKLGSVLGYLVAGLLIGPAGFGWIGHVDDVIHFAEFGVVLLLFIIGLELQPSRLWVMRKRIFGLGGAQVIATGALIALTAMILGLEWQASFVIGASLALSSTAFALQVLAEKKQLSAQHGRAAFAVLLFQDVAVIPLLALIPLLATGQQFGMEEPLWLRLTIVIGAIGGGVIGGRYLLRPAFRLVAATHSHEIFTAFSLLVVIVMALLMEWAGLSMALGAFLAGVLLADSEFRHELEANIEPFKGLLLGLFFIAVGMSVNVGLITEAPVTILMIVLALMVGKASILYVLGRFSGIDRAGSMLLSGILPQGGEFAFVLFGVAVTYGVLQRELADLLIVVVSLTMALTPLCVMLAELITARNTVPTTPATFDEIHHQQSPVIVAGFGRFGQVVARVLKSRRIPFTALESSMSQVDFVRRFGSKIHYGDVTRLDLLRAAGAEHAKILILAVDDVERSKSIAKTVRQNFPQLKIMARARNRQHAFALMDLGVHHIARETLLSSLSIAQDALQALGMSHAEASRTTRQFYDYDEALLKRQHEFHQDEARVIDSAQQAARDLEELFEQDDQQTLKSKSLHNFR